MRVVHVAQPTLASGSATVAAVTRLRHVAQRPHAALAAAAAKPDYVRRPAEGALATREEALPALVRARVRVRVSVRG